LVTPLLAALTGRNGLDIELDVFNGGRQYVYLSEVAPAGSASWVHSLIDKSAAPVSAGPNQRNLLNVALDRSGGEVLSRDLLSAPAADRLAAADHPFPGHWCTNYKKDVIGASPSKNRLADLPVFVFGKFIEVA